MLVPEDFDPRRLVNEEERRVVEACVHGLSDGWLVLPDLGPMPLHLQVEHAVLGDFADAHRDPRVELALHADPVRSWLRVLELEHAGHYLFEDDPQRCVDELRQFVQDRI